MLFHCRLRTTLSHSAPPPAVPCAPPTAPATRKWAGAETWRNCQSISINRCHPGQLSVAAEPPFQTIQPPHHYSSCLDSLTSATLPCAPAHWLASEARCTPDGRFWCLRCDCPRHRTGLSCEREVDDVDAVCKLYSGWGLGDCLKQDQHHCVNACNGRGRCIGGFCQCQPGGMWAGEQASTKGAAGDAVYAG